MTPEHKDKNGRVIEVGDHVKHEGMWSTGYVCGILPTNIEVRGDRADQS